MGGCPRNTHGLQCEGRGKCNIDAENDTVARCDCVQGFGGPNCEKAECPTAIPGTVCSGNGDCEDKGPLLGGRCKCRAPHGGKDCAGLACPVNFRGSECSNNVSAKIVRGVCNRATGKCECKAGLKGDACDKIPSKAFCTIGCDDSCSKQCAVESVQDSNMYMGCHAECNSKCISDCLLGKQADSVDVAYNPDQNGTRLASDASEKEAAQQNERALYRATKEGVSQKDRELKAKAIKAKTHKGAISEKEIYPKDMTIILVDDSDVDHADSPKPASAAPLGSSGNNATSSDTGNSRQTTGQGKEAGNDASKDAGKDASKDAGKDASKDAGKEAQKQDRTAARQQSSGPSVSTSDDATGNVNSSATPVLDDGKKRVALEFNVDYDWVIKHEGKFSDALISDLSKQIGIDAKQLTVVAVKQGSTIAYIEISSSSIYKGSWAPKDWLRYIVSNLKADAFDLLSSATGMKVTGKVAKVEPCRT